MRRRTARWSRSLPWLALLLSAALYAAHFFLGGGSAHRILDSWAYLQVASGEQAAVPFNTRIVTPLLAALVATVTGLSASEAFGLLTPSALLASLLLMRASIGRRGGSDAWQAAVMLAFGCSLAVTFGYTPVLADPTLLLLACLTIAALDVGQFTMALALVCIATLTKEYGLVLAFIFSFHSYRRGFRKLAFAGLIMPVTALLIVMLARQSSSGIGFNGWPTFAYHVMFEYQLSVFRARGPGDYARLLYMWSWCGLWPSLFLSTLVLASRIRKRIVTSDEIQFAIVLASLPVLLLGDWSRALIVVVPFACIVATSHPLTDRRHFILLLAVGGLSTALARPFHSETPLPHLFTLTMTAVSVASSFALGVILVRQVFRRAMQRSSGSREAAVEGVVP